MLTIPTCTCCGKPFKHIGDERSEQLHFRPLYDMLCALILLSYCLGIDATKVKYREPGVQDKCKAGFVWLHPLHHPRQCKTTRTERVRVPRRSPRTTQRLAGQCRTSQNATRPMESTNSIESQKKGKYRQTFVNSRGCWSRYL